MEARDDESLMHAAAQCNDCVGWVDYCSAECCHVFTFFLTPRSDVVCVDDLVRIHTPLTRDAARYYELHGAEIEEGEYVVVPREHCQFSPTRLVVNMTCRELRDDFMCALHDGRQPDSCKDFTLETSSDSDWVVTPRCLFAYKARLPKASG